MELLAPAGDLEKLRTAYFFGADAAYIGLGGFSLRSRGSEVALTEQADQLRQIKGPRRLYGALNIYFHDSDVSRLKEMLPAIKELPLDALIVSDIGVVELIKKSLPDVELHLSTQANCLNANAAHFYHSIGFSRIVPARELSLEDIARIKEKTPEMEVELFVHGAMCLAYSGRCLLSAWETGRSANKGECSHSCRWEYRHFIEEKKRPGELMPVEEGDGHSTILSARDLCMIDYLAELRSAGADALKIEGRMKSRYYVATVTQAYRAEIDRITAGGIGSTTERFSQELHNVSHREFSTGFYFGDPKETYPTTTTYTQRYRFLGSVEEEVAPGTFRLSVLNSFALDDRVEFVGPGEPGRSISFTFVDRDGGPVSRVTHHSDALIRVDQPVSEGWLIRTPTATPENG